MKIGNIRLNIVKVDSQGLHSPEAPSVLSSASDPYVLAVLRRLSPSADEIAAGDTDSLISSEPTIFSMSDYQKPTTPEDLENELGDQLSDEFLESSSFEPSDDEDDWTYENEGPSKLTSHEASPDGWFDFGPSPFPPIIGGFPLLDDLPPGASNLA
ncbi:hypothetical protein Psta_1572 [Pirellula staleyi DSM 6068]|uniref:Uncharacterized protein n=1 Tax=Pirellula staleyi (strain ATCC 27377 / DSM 6068 / ICPB 4128) TaxID=530564 RepID=D2QY33_PIRSD|nr:hypothetical protein [Pirellula staleyi]ADB16247.1 hypothetical protein Psta_1572 [Pirellula staleyi DSM 6068]